MDYEPMCVGLLALNAKVFRPAERQPVAISGCSNRLKSMSR